MIPARERALRHVAQALAVLLLASAASAQESAWPSRTIQIVVPYTPGTGADTWYGVFAPAGTAGAIISKLNAEVNALLKQPEIRELLAKQGLVPAGGTPERFGELVRKELARWSRVVAAAGIKGE